MDNTHFTQDKYATPLKHAFTSSKLKVKKNESFETYLAIYCE